MQRCARPFFVGGGGEKVSAITETKGWIGERYGPGAGLQYLNARYYDPELGLFLQPDWFEVTEAGGGTNRYAYSFNDLVNLRDPLGNSADNPTMADYAIGALAQGIHQAANALFPSRDWNSQEALTDLPGAELVVGDLVDLSEAETLSEAATAIGMAYTGPALDAFKFTKGILRGPADAAGGAGKKLPELIVSRQRYLFFHLRRGLLE